jgi:hypothetical protein
MAGVIAVFPCLITCISFILTFLFRNRFCSVYRSWARGVGESPVVKAVLPA